MVIKKTLKKLKIPESVINHANEDVERQTFQAMEGFVHNLNTMHSRAGAQVPLQVLTLVQTLVSRVVSHPMLTRCNRSWTWSW